MSIFIIGKKRKDEKYWKPWMVRAIEGHRMPGVDVQESAYFLLPSQIKCLPAMCHGAKQQATPSILYSGLSPAGRQSGMFSVFRAGIAGLGEANAQTRGSLRQIGTKFMDCLPSSPSWRDHQVPSM